MKGPLIRFLPFLLTAVTLDRPSAFAQTTERVSVDSWGGQGNSYSRYPSISADGRYVAFESYATNLVPGDTNRWDDVFVHDRQTGQTNRVSVNSTGVQGNSLSGEPSISADGRYVAFWSGATNLVLGHTNGVNDVFVHDRQTGQTSLVSVDSAGVQGNSYSLGPSISADGRHVAFWSAATNLVPGDTNGVSDVFVHNRQTGQTNRVSVDSAGVQAEFGAFGRPSISADGRHVAFASSSSNLVPGDTNGLSDVFVHDRQTGQTSRISVDSAGVQGNSYSDIPSISADGRYVAFRSYAANLVPGDTNGSVDIFVHDRQTDQTSRVSVDSAGVQGNWNSFEPSISADGRYVAFASDANNLVPGDTNGRADIFVHDCQTGQTRRVSVDSAGVQGNSDSDIPSISADGRYVAFHSYAANLVPGDTNSSYDVFVHDRGASGLSLAKNGTCPGQVNLTISNATAGDRVVLAYGAAGSFTQNDPNLPCQGTSVSLRRPTVGTVLRVDSGGSASLTANMPSGVCGLTMQGIDLGSCTTTNPITL